MDSTEAFLAFLVVSMALGASGIVVWILRSAAVQRDRQALAFDDLLRLEETVSALIDRLKASSDEAVKAMEQRQEQLEEVLRLCDRKIQTASIVEPTIESSASVQPTIGDLPIDEPVIGGIAMAGPNIDNLTIDESMIVVPSNEESTIVGPNIDGLDKEPTLDTAPPDLITDEVEVARRSGMLRGELDLMIELQALKQ